MGGSIVIMIFVLIVILIRTVAHFNIRLVQINIFWCECKRILLEFVLILFCDRQH